MKAAEGREAQIRYCVSCNTCWHLITTSSKLRCDNNPRVGLGDEADWRPARTATPKRVVVVGAGPAGMEAGWIAAAMAEFKRIIRGGLASGAELTESALAYRREVTDHDPRFVKHARTWLRQGCWVDHARSKSTETFNKPAGRTRFVGPPELVREIAAQCGEAFVASYLDRAEFDPELRRIIPGSSTALVRLGDKAGYILAKHGVTLGTPKSMANAA